MFFGSRSRTVEVDVNGDPPVKYPLCDKTLRNCAHIPLRLTPSERKRQRLVRGILLASSYTDKVDTVEMAKSQPKRQMRAQREVNNIVLGLVTAISQKEAGRCVEAQSFEAIGAYIQRFFEFQRRYKIMNPDMLRTDYIKFLYMLQDAAAMTETLGFSVVAPIMTVGECARANGFEDLLKDPRLGLMTTPVPKIEDRTKLNKALRYKDLLVDKVVKQYASKASVAPELVELVVRSINDVNSFANTNVDSVGELIKLLRRYFSPDTPTSDLQDLGIAEGKGGSRLTHAHAAQYVFVLQTLTFWKNIGDNMNRLWVLAENDLLNVAEVPYEFRSTGQGYQRVQAAPGLYNAVQEILNDTKKEVGQWVGLDKVHLGDNQVPNAFAFIDKYAQIGRIVNPLLRTIDHVETVAKDAHRAAYITEVWGSVEGAQRAILRDFFRFGFDGSGGDNMDDAGSCVDGRLTSAWHWCNNIRDKPYYPLFLFSGFSSFDGDLSL